MSQGLTALTFWVLVHFLFIFGAIVVYGVQLTLIRSTISIISIFFSHCCQLVPTESDQVCEGWVQPAWGGEGPREESSHHRQEDDPPLLLPLSHLQHLLLAGLSLWPRGDWEQMKWRWLIVAFLEVNWNLLLMLAQGAWQNKRNARICSQLCIVIWNILLLLSI